MSTKYRVIVTKTVEVQSWLPPSYIVCSGDDSIPLEQVDAESLSMLCDDWRASVFAKAGKVDPRLSP